MDLIVFANGAPRNVSGVTKKTTCAEVVYALAHATNQKGQFVLVSTFSNSNQEHRLKPDECLFALVEDCISQGVEITFELLKLPDLNNEFLDAEAKNDDNRIVLSDSELKNSEKNCDNNNHQSDYYNNSHFFHPLQHQKNLFQQQSDEGDLICASKSFMNSPHNNFMNQKNETKSYRHPPPAYNEVIEQRCNTLTKNSGIIKNLNSINVSSNPTTTPFPLTFSTILNLSVNDLCSQNFTREGLENFIDAQSKVIAAQKNELLGLELTLSNDAEREFVQLKKQHNNLQTVLNSLRNGDWKMRVEAEQCEAERLHTAIDAMKTAIENKGRELYQVLELERTLELQFALEEGKQQKFFENNNNTIALQDSNEKNKIVYS